jgi:hypothetical protein
MGDADVEGVGGYGSREHSSKHGAAAPSQHQPEGADDFGGETIAQWQRGKLLETVVITDAGDEYLSTVL